MVNEKQAVVDYGPGTIVLRLLMIDHMVSINRDNIDLSHVIFT